MNPLLRLAGLYFDTVLKSWFPLEKEPSLADLEAEALAVKEAGEEVSEPRFFGGYGDPEPDPLERLVCLVEDIRNLLRGDGNPYGLPTVTNAEIGAAINQQTDLLKELRSEIRSSVVSAAETPGEEPSTSPGDPKQLTLPVIERVYLVDNQQETPLEFCGEHVHVRIEFNHEKTMPVYSPVVDVIASDERVAHASFFGK